MVRKSRKRVLAGFMTLLATSVALAQNPARADFSLRSIDGQTVTSDSLRGEIVVLAFGASWLPLSTTVTELSMWIVTLIWSQKPASASSIELSTTS